MRGEERRRCAQSWQSSADVLTCLLHSSTYQCSSYKLNPNLYMSAQDLDGQQMRHLVQALCPAILGQVRIMHDAFLE